MSCINITCSNSNCNKEFTVEFKFRNKKYCSRKCYFNDPKSKVGRVKDANLYEKRFCIICETEFEVTKKSIKTMCSHNCRIIHMKKPEVQKEKLEKTKKTNVEKYGVEYLLTSDIIKEKIKNTNIERYGVEIPAKSNLIIEKIKNSQKDLNYKIVVSKRKKTKLEKYDDENYNNREKFKETIKTLDNTLITKKRKETVFERYGVLSSLNLDGVKEKSKIKMIELYGTEYYMQSNQYKEIVKDRNTIKFIDRVTKLGFELITLNSVESCVLKCIKCSNETHTTQLKNNKEVICRYCFPINSNNKIQSLFEDILKESGLKYRKNDRLLIKPYEVDYVIDDYRLAFEINGNYYHSELGGGKDKKYHLNKTKLCDSIGYHLVHIFEDELLFKYDIVKSRILAMLGKSGKIYARKTAIRSVNRKDEMKFLKENHIQGYAVSTYCIGLYHKDILVALMSFVENRLVKSKQTELLRYCSILNNTIVGGFSKLLKYFIDNNSFDKLISYADLRYSNYNPIETVYYKNNFKFITRTEPNYWYVSRNNYLGREHRLKFRKSELIKLGYDLTKTEKNIMLENGYDIIWDCGSHKFQFSK